MSGKWITWSGPQTGGGPGPRAPPVSLVSPGFIYDDFGAHFRGDAQNAVLLSWGECTVMPQDTQLRPQISRNSYIDY